MITQEEFDEFESKLRYLVESDFTGLDIVHFVRENALAQRLLCSIDFIDYKEQVRFICEHDDSDIRGILETPSGQYYDNEYGDLDRIGSFRLNKSDYEDDEECEDLTYDNIGDQDNILGHLYGALCDEPIEIPMSDVLTRENLNKLVHEGYTCAAEQIYYFEIYDDLHCYFAHYYDCGEGNWDCSEWEIDLGNFDYISNTFFNGSMTAEDAEEQFFSILETSYKEELGEHHKYDSLAESVYNGVGAMNQLKAFATPEVRVLAERFEKECLSERRNESDEIDEQLEPYKDFLSSKGIDYYNLINVLDHNSSQLMLSLIKVLLKDISTKDRKISNLENKLDRILQVIYSGKS